MTATSHDGVSSAAEALDWGTSESRTHSPTSRPLRSSAGAVALFVLTSAFTSQISYADPIGEFARSGSSSVLDQQSRLSAKRLTLRQARQLALQVLKQAKQDLIHDRQAEASFTLDLWDA